MRCLLGARFSMTAEILSEIGVNSNSNSPDQGTWVSSQDPITGERNSRWVSAPDNPSTPGAVKKTVPCIARGVVDGGIRVAGTTENFGDWYESVEYVKMWTPARHILKKGDRVTSIRKGATGPVIWLDEEHDNEPTVFDVQGCTPLFDAFNKHIENYIMLKRSD